MTQRGDLVQIDEGFLALDPDASGLHRRLMAGLDSLCDRAGCPMIESVRRGRSARDAGKPYNDFDAIVRLAPGHSGYRQVTGFIEVPLHVTGSGNVTRQPMYEAVRYDLTVGSGATHYEPDPKLAPGKALITVPDETTRFAGEFAAGYPSVYVREAMAAREADEDRPPGHTSMFTLLRLRAYHLLSRAADAALLLAALDQDGLREGGSNQ
jgi:hypothetical protein